MKFYTFGILFICLSSLYALAVPENVRATAIGHDAFTLRWDAVDEAESYAVELLKATQDYSVDEGFEGLSNFPAGWANYDSSIKNYPMLAHNESSYLCAISQNEGYVRLPELSEPCLLRFWSRCSSNTSSFTLRIQESVDNENWTDLVVLKAISGGIGEITPEYKEFNIPINVVGGSSKFVRFYKSAGLQAAFLDDVKLQLTNAIPCSQMPEYPAIRITNMEQSSEYLYRVRAIAEDQEGTFSDWKFASTNAMEDNSSTGSAINGVPAEIVLTTPGAFSVQRINIAPSSVDDADYLASVTQSLSSYTYSIQCEDNTALNAEYTISHPGFTANEVYTNTGSLDSFSFEPGVSTLRVSGIAAKGELTITLNLEEDTLPVTLSYFNVFIVNPTTCRIDWTSQSESGTLGYRILRGKSDQLSEAMTVSSLIEAQNSSSTQHYSYLDPNPEYSPYYWLVAVNMDTSEDIYGPRRVDIPSNATSIDLDYRDELVVFPNPMSHEATLQITTQHEQYADLRVYNMRGQLVREDALGTLGKGKHCLPFDCRDRDGKALPSGVYLLELRYPQGLLQSKFVITE